MMKIITAPANPNVKEWKKLSTKKGRLNQERYLLEGWHLVKEAFVAQAEILQVIVTNDFILPEQVDLENLDVFQITPEIAKILSQTPSPQGIFVTVKLPKAQLIPKQATGAWLFLDGVQDPGNIGTMVRTADAAGFSGVVFGENTADPYQPKVTRAMQGSQFHLHLVKASLIEWIDAFQAKNLPVFGTELNQDARSYDQVGQYSDFALIMGNEGNGMSFELLKQTSLNLYIPIKGQAESLNVAVAAGILMFKLKR